MTEQQFVVTEKIGSIAYVHFNRPQLRNAFNQAMIRQITQAFENLATDKSLRAVVVKGNGKAFCAGADLEYMQQVANFGYDENVADGLLLAGMFEAIASCPSPVIGMVHGASMGGANGILAVCDLVICETNTLFAFSEVKVGIIPAVISPYVLSKMQTRLAHELMLPGRKFTAKEALNGGLVNYIVESDAMEAKLQEVINELLTASPLAVAQCKNLLRSIPLGGNPNTMHELSTQFLARARSTSEGKEGLRAFLEKRKPNWIE